MTEEQVQEQSTPEEEPAKLEEEKPEVKYTDKDVDKLKGSARKEGRQSALKDLLDELGAESLDDLKESYQGFKTVEEETQSEAEKARKDAEKLKAERDEARAATEAANKLADERLKKAELRLELINEGARKDRLSKIVRDADLSEVEIEDEEVKNLAPVVNALKEEYPEWFGSGVTQDIPGSPPAGDLSELTAEKKQQNEELARRQLHRAF